MQNSPAGQKWTMRRITKEEGENLTIPTGLEAALYKVLQSVLIAAVQRTGKRLWVNRISTKRKREKALLSTLARLEEHNFQDKLRIGVVVPALPLGISLVEVEKELRTVAFEAVLQELVAARVMKTSENTVKTICDTLCTALRVSFSSAVSDSNDLTRFGEIVFQELDRVVKELVSELENLDSSAMAALRQRANLTMITRSIESIGRHNSLLKSAIDPAAVGVWLEWEDSYRALVRAAHGHIEPPDFERKRKVPIEELFVSPNIVTSGSQGGTSSSVDVWGLYRNIDRTVLLGDPGGGKSTASGVIAWNAAVDESGLIPFVVVLRDFAKREISFLEHIEQEVARTYQCAAPKRAIEAIFLSGRAMIIFDGLDELIDTTDRRRVTDLVELFCTRYPLSRVLVTSRRVGYLEAALDSNIFEVFELAEFTEQNVHTYVNNWFRRVERLEEDEAIVFADSFMEESAVAFELRRNPLMLALMCIIYRGQQWIPRNLPDMYEHCAGLLFEKWDHRRKIHVELQARAHVDAAIKHLAFWMFTEESAVQGMEESRLVEEAAKFLVPVCSTELEARQAAQQFVDFCRGRAWVLTPVGSNAEGEELFGFKHRTFMEYFAAYELTRRHDGPIPLAKSLLPHVAAAEWEMVAQMAIQISNRHSRDGAARILETILDDKRYRSASSRQNIANFSIRCLSFVHAPIPVARRIAKNFINSTVQTVYETRYLQDVDCSVVPELADVVDAEIMDVLRRHIVELQDPLRPLVKEFILDLPSLMTDINTTRQSPKFQKWDNHRRDLFGELRDYILSPPDANIWTAARQASLISISELIMEGPFAHTKYPLDIIFYDSDLPNLRHGWTDWGSYASATFFQMEELEAFVNVVEVEISQLIWLGEYLESLNDPPWVSFSADTTVRFMPNQDVYHFDRLVTEAGWPMLMLFFVALEGALEVFEENFVDNIGSLPEMVRVFLAARIQGKALPAELVNVVAKLPKSRRELVEGWLDNRISLIASGAGGDS